MTRFAIDAETLLVLAQHHWTVPPAHQLVGPNALRSDALALALDEVRTGRASEQSALATHEVMTGVKIRLFGDRVSRRVAWRIAEGTVPASLRDAEYVAVAKLQADALVTGSPQLERLAVANDVAIATVEELLGHAVDRESRPASR